MTLSKEDVEKIAHLARLSLTAEEKQVYQQQLSAVLDYANMLNELDLSQVVPPKQAAERKNIMRDDEIVPGLDLEDVLYNAASHSQDQFRIQAVLDD